jgi:hypothetical protein
MGVNIEVGQEWRTRCGVVVWVSADRAEGHSGWPGVETWRWALSNGHIADENGRVGLNGKDHPFDLIELTGHRK